MSFAQKYHAAITFTPVLVKIVPSNHARMIRHFCYCCVSLSLFVFCLLFLLNKKKKVVSFKPGTFIKASYKSHRIPQRARCVHGFVYVFLNKMKRMLYKSYDIYVIEGYLHYNTFTKSTT